METKGTTQEELNNDSTSWGNYYNNLWTVTNVSAKYSTDYGDTYTATPYTKTANAEVLLTTGASSEFNKAGIYDLAGNVSEWSFLDPADVESPGRDRGGSFWKWGEHYPASEYYEAHASDSCDVDIGFRVVIY